MEVKPGLPQKNTAKMLEMIESAKGDGAEIIIFSELCLSGYMISDLWERESFLRECQVCNDRIRQASNDIVVIWGNVDIDWNLKNEDGRVRKYNACFVAENGNYLQQKKTKLFCSIKTLMPEYREFEDNRHFYSYRKLIHDKGIKLEDAYEPFILGNGLRVGCIICEDGWSNDYTISPMMHLTRFPKSDIIVNISCSPFTKGKNDKRNRVFADKASDSNTPMIYVNCVGIQDNGKNVYSFDGGSCIYDRAGNINNLGLPFEEFTKTIDFDISKGFSGSIVHQDGIEDLYNAIKYSAKKFMERLNIDKVVIGASGGIDSALVSAIMSEILPKENILLVNMPSKYNSDLTKNAAKKLADNIGCRYIVHPIAESYNLTYNEIRDLNSDTHTNFIPYEKRDLTSFMLENVQARDRSSRVLAAWAAWFGGVFTCNANKSEICVGYSTLYGDLSGFLAPIADLWKGQVYKMAGWFNKNVKNIIPSESLDVIPSAELSSEQDVTKGKGDPINYPYHDKLFASWVERWNRATPEDILAWYINDNLEKEIGYKGKVKELFKSDKDFINDLERWWQCYQGLGIAKRIQSPPVVSISCRSFGYDHRESQLGVSYSQKYYELKNKLIGDKK